MGTAMLDWAIGEKIGFSKFVNIGNKADVTEIDMLEILKDDTDNNVILGYIEGVTDGVEFMKRTKEVSQKKPLVIIRLSVLLQEQRLPHLIQIPLLVHKRHLMLHLKRRIS